MGCALKLNALVFDEIIFKRIGMHSDNELEISFSVSIGTNVSDEDIKKVSVRISGEKEKNICLKFRRQDSFPMMVMRKIPLFSRMQLQL